MKITKMPPPSDEFNPEQNTIIVIIERRKTNNRSKAYLILTNFFSEMNKKIIAKIKYTTKREKKNL